MSRNADEDQPPINERQAFEAEARRQSLVTAELARDPNSDEAAALRWLEALLAEHIDEWK